MAKSQIRMLPPIAPSTTDPITISGRTYRSLGASFVDMYAPDAQVAADNGWQPMALVGQTADRPVPADWDSAQLLQPGVRFIDLTLDRVVQWDASAGVWRDGVTGVPS